MNNKSVIAFLLIFLVGLSSVASSFLAKSESAFSSFVSDGGPVVFEDVVIEENLALDNVTLAFDLLTYQGEWLGFHMGVAPDTYPPPGDEHFQGIARSPRTGISPIFYVTRSGNKGNLWFLGHP